MTERDYWLQDQALTEAELQRRNAAGLDCYETRKRLLQIRSKLAQLEVGVEVWKK